METIKVCRVCGKEFTPPKHNPYANNCSRKCLVYSINQKYHKDNPHYQREATQKVKKEIFKLLGSKCVVCGYDGVALQVDHIKNNGKKEIAKVKEHGSNYTYWKYILQKIKDGSKDYQLMCPTHNMEKEIMRRENAE